MYDEKPERVAMVTGYSGFRTMDEIARFLPSNYEIADEVIENEDSIYSARMFIRGHDVAGWTLDGYVIPRLASGLIWAEEVFEDE